jgi:hypothetical protein
MKRVSHPPFAPGLDLSDFYLPGKVKNALMGAEFGGERDLFDRVMCVLNAIPRNELTLFSTNS